MYKPLVNNEDRCATIVEKWDTSPSTVRKHHESHNITNEDLTRSHHLVINEQSSVIWAQTKRRSRETDAASRYKVSGKG